MYSNLSEAMENVDLYPLVYLWFSISGPEFSWCCLSTNSYVLFYWIVEVSEVLKSNM